MKLYFMNQSSICIRTRSNIYMCETYCLFSLQKVSFSYYNEPFNEPAGAVLLLQEIGSLPLMSLFTLPDSDKGFHV